MSRKRAAPSDEVEDGDETFQSTRSKRSRANGHTAGDDTSDVDITEAGVPANGHAEEAVDELEDPDADAFEGGELDELAERSEDEAMREEIRLHRRGAHEGPAEAGVIDKVDLKNFMCHEHLTLKLGQQLTFVIGHNGSGKSAILTGITLALGGKASSTSRGSSLKTFVRNGTNAAEIILTMRNEGVEAFKPELYGKRIIIERRIMAAGASTWRMKNAAGKIVSSKREEIDAYCDHTNIQVDNPMNVLSQDAARQFLSSSHAKDKYSFFLKGTQLNQLATEYENIRTAVSHMKLRVARQEEAIPDLEKQVRDAMHRFKMLDRARSQKEEFANLQKQMVWSQVYGKEKEVKQQRDKAELAREKLNKVKEDIEEKAAALEAMDAEIADLESLAHASRDREQPIWNERDQVIKEIRTQKTLVQSLEEETKQLNEQFTRFEDDIKRLQKQIDEESARLAQDNREKIEALQAESVQCEQERDDAHGQEVELREELTRLENSTGPLLQRIDDLKREMNGVQRTIAEREVQVQQLNSARTERLELYGPHMKSLVAAIESHTGWLNKPLGPIGRFVKLRDERWSGIIESVLNNLLSAFMVTNLKDKVELDTLLTRMNIRNVSIVTAKPDLFDFSMGEPEPSVLTIHRALEVTNDQVLRTLVNLAFIEKTALVPRRVDGDALMRRDLRNVKFAYSQDLFKIQGGLRGSSTQTVNPFRGTPRLTANVNNGLLQAQEQLKDAEQQKLKLDKDLRDAQREYSENQKAKQDIKNKLPALQRKVRQLNNRIQQIAEDLREDEPANVAALQDNKEEAERDQAKVVEAIQDVIKRRKEAKAGLTALADKAEKLKEQIKAMANSRDTFKEKLEVLTPKRMEVFCFVQHRRDQLKEKEVDHQNQVALLGQMEAELADWTAQAEEFCPRVEAPLRPEEYGNKIDAIEKHAAMAKKRGVENIDDVLADLKAKRHALSQAKDDIENLRSITKMFDQSVDSRQKRWLTFQRTIAVRARNNFVMHLENRGYTGSLSFDHKAEKLRLRVQTEDMTSVRSEKDPKSLSGGEKSFATICLLLALWEAIGCPIRCLDEFDVFMDAVNRKISMRMIAETAKNNPSTQFVLITPQNMANVNFGPEVRILRMSDPERGQGVLHAGNSG